MARYIFLGLVWLAIVGSYGGVWKLSEIHTENKLGLIQANADIKTASAVLTRQADNYERTLKMAEKLNGINDKTETGIALGTILDELQPNPGPFRSGVRQ